MNAVISVLGHSSKMCLFTCLLKKYFTPCRNQKGIAVILLIQLTCAAFLKKNSEKSQTVSEPFHKCPNSFVSDADGNCTCGVQKAIK